MPVASVPARGFAKASFGSERRGSAFRSRAAGWCATALLLIPSVGYAQTFTPFSVFQSMSQSELATLQVKLTWLGFQTHSTVTVALTANGHTPNLTLFVPFQRPGFDYSNDTAAPESLTASVQELDAMLDGVATLPGVTDGGVDAAGDLSFALLNTAGGTQAFEAILDTTNAALLFAQMRGALGANISADRGLRELACTLDLLPGTPPPEVSSSVTFALTGFRLERATGEMVGVVKVTNITGTPLAGPLTLVVIPTENVELIGESGRTCRIEPGGQTFVVLGGGATLAPSATVQQVLRFSNPDLDAIAPELHLHSGPGPQ
jgi:hypothetical protein